MQKVLMMIVVLFFATNIFSFEFRGSYFGMFPDDVKDIETCDFMYQDSLGSLVYLDSLFGEDVYVVYVFDSLQYLTTTSYLFVHTWENDEWYYILFENCKQYLKSQFGGADEYIRQNTSMFFTSGSWSDLMSAIKWKQGMIAYYWYDDDVDIVLGIFPSGYFDKSMIIIFKEK